ncbi:stage II sporulation protein R [uncultured Clostridium sp.]|uniref:stage II sporulation protein R n=1 Tax=uncultured Clostridium sp. TaxID=59620 RepID=UPI002616C899|nr:stage II sporulation protein R [uncultured Clostridium sp.]
MKKIILGIVSLVILIGGFIAINGNSVQVTSMEGISEKIIRFHVLANSDSDKDQELKLKVRDEVIGYMTPILNESKSLNESRELLLSNQEKVIEIAKEVIKKEGYDYDVNVELAMTNFPVKTYGNVTLPQGEYEAFRVLIGEAKGENWWCVMFPPLCFIDMSKGQISYEKSEEQLSGVLTEEEQSLITDSEDSKIEFRFKIADLFKNK